MTSENLRIRLDSSAAAGTDAEGSTAAGVAIAEEVDWDRGPGFDGLVVMIAGVARLGVPSTAASASVFDACLGLPRRSSSPSALRTGLAKGLDTAERSPSVTVSALVGLVSESPYPPKPCASACSDGPLRVGVSCTC